MSYIQDIDEHIEQHVFNNWPAPDLSAVSPSELLDAFAVAWWWCKLAEIADDKAASWWSCKLAEIADDKAEYRRRGGARTRKHVERGFAIREELRDRLLTLLSPEPEARP